MNSRQKLPMDPTKIIIENWPHTPWYRDWNLIIAVIALSASLISLYWTRKDFIKGSRPFVWASSYGVVDSNNKTIIPVPWRLGCRVKNSPAKIKFSEVKVYLDKKELFSHKDENFVRFPDDRSEWDITIGKKDWADIVNRTPEEQAKLVRVVSMKYSALDGGKIYYYYKLEQSFDPQGNQWRDTSANAN